MIESFVSSWGLFANTYLAGWGIAFLLSLLGVWVVAREQIFLGAAVAQASTLGVAIALFAATVANAEGLASHPARLGAAIAFALGATLLTSRGGRGRETHEAITGWVFLLSAAGATLLLARSPHGREEIEQLLTSSLIGATGYDVGQFAVASLGAAVAAALLWRPLLLFAMDPAMAAAVGLREARWSGAMALALGASVGLSIHVSGTLYTFGCLVLPALVARRLAREARQMLWLSPAVALAASVAGFVVANHQDLPPAQVTVALLCGALLAVWALRTGGR